MDISEMKRAGNLIPALTLLTTSRFDSESTEKPIEKPTDMPTESTPKIPCSVQILRALSKVSEMRTKDIHAAVTTKTKSYITKTIKELCDAGKIVKKRHGWYAMNRTTPNKSPRYKGDSNGEEVEKLSESWRVFSGK